MNPKAAALLTAIAERKAAALPKEPIPLSTFLYLYTKAPNKWEAMESDSYQGTKQLIEFLSPISIPSCLAYQRPLPGIFATYELMKLAELLGGVDWRIIAWSLLEMNGVVIKKAKPAQNGGLTGRAGFVTMDTLADKAGSTESGASVN